MSAPLLEYSRVTVCRGARVALDNISFSIDDGEHTVILGPNGSGKSTLIKTITRECYPRQGGHVRILGRETWNIFELRPLLGVVSNDLMETCTRPMTGWELLLSGFFGSIGIWPNHHVTAAMETKAREVLELLEVPHLAARDMNAMSSGEARRMLIGRALIHNPKAIVLDEPTNSLDIRAVHELRDVLRKIVAGGTTLILVTHHLPDILPEMNRVILMRDGRIVEDGPKEDILTGSHLSNLFGTEIEVMQKNCYLHMW